MKLSNRHDLALGMLINLGEKATTLRSTATTLKTSLSYLEPIAHKLRRAGLIKSCRGPGGGYVRDRPLEDISVGEVLAIFGEDKSPVRVGVIDRIVDHVAFLTLADLEVKYTPPVEEPEEVE